ncbi:uncharacterized protein [Temnothorax nylanderi]|uniref:uncharacterized protein n=1 Tax=Temnothorax nylanderi TaxID=102681 RepID=UPI003A8774CD
MFYPVELLSHRRRAKLAPCWLATMIGKKLFTRHYPSGAIKKINTVETWDEYDAVQDLELPAIDVPISSQNFPNAELEIDLLPDEDLDNRLQMIMKDAACCNFGGLNDKELDFMLKHDFNLSLDRMHELQISEERSAFPKKTADITIEEEVFEMQQKFDSGGGGGGGGGRGGGGRGLRDEYDAVQDLELPAIDVPIISSQNFPNAELEIDLHLLPDEDLDNRLQMIMKDAACCNFGGLNDKELDFMLKHDFNLSVDRMHELQISEERSAFPKKTAGITIEEIQEKQLSQETRGPVLVDISERKKSKEGLLLTPQKRQSHQMQVETPTKRRRLFFETASATDEPGDSVANVLTVTNIIHETMDVSMVPLPEEVPEAIVLEEGTTIVEQRPDQERINISNDESFEDIVILFERLRQSPKTKHIPVPSTSSPSRPSQPTLLSEVILALLEVLWVDKMYVKFSELIRADTFTREEATTVFEILRDLYAQQKLVLQLTDCCDTLWISKYQN